jgi:hypothetical protein
MRESEGKDNDEGKAAKGMWYPLAGKQVLIKG